VRAVFADAISIAPGLDVQANGVDIGKVKGVKYEDGQAIVDLGIKSDSVWPLHRGTTATIRFGTTVGNGTRRVDIAPGPSNTPVIPDGGMIESTDTRIPTEFDQFFQTFGKRTRGDLQYFAQTWNGTFRDRAKQLSGGVRWGGPAIESAGGVFGDLAVEDRALHQLVRYGDAATATLAARASQIRGLMTVAAQTFDTFARNSGAMEQSIQEFPGTLRQTRTTLARLDTSLDNVQPLMADLRPGAAKLRPLAASMRPAIAQLRETVPGARDAVFTLRKASPDVTALLAKGTPFMRKLNPMFADLAPISACVRPYAPDIAAFFSNWLSFTQHYDDRAHYARVRVNEGPSSSTDTPNLTTEQFVKLTPLRYVGLRPPGFNGGKPLFLPQCGVGEDVVNPAKDWEDGR